MSHTRFAVRCRAILAALPLLALSATHGQEPPDGSILVARRLGVPVPGRFFLDAAQIQPDGRTVMVGFVPTGEFQHTVVGRLLANGDPDPTFGTFGFVAAPIPELADLDFRVRSLAVEPATGRILVVGGEQQVNGPTRGAVFRLLPDGAPDPGFGADGLIWLTYGTTSPAPISASGIDVADNGKIYLSGVVDPEGPVGLRVALVRLLSDGSYDPTYSGDGRALVDAFGVRHLRLLGDGSLLLAGSGPSIARITANALLDPSFGSAGHVTLHWPTLPAGGDGIHDLELDAEGRILVVGWTCAHLDFRGFCDAETWGVARLLPNGALDTSFSGDGLVYGPPCSASSCSGSQQPYLTSVSAQGDGRSYWVGGRYADLETRTDIFVQRRLENGEPDLAYGPEGWFTIDHSAPPDIWHDGAHHVELDPEGRPVLVGNSVSVDKLSREFSFARLASSLIFADSFDRGSLSAWRESAP